MLIIQFRVFFPSFWPVPSCEPRTCHSILSFHRVFSFVSLTCIPAIAIYRIFIARVHASSCDREFLCAKYCTSRYNTCTLRFIIHDIRLRQRKILEKIYVYYTIYSYVFVLCISTKKYVTLHTFCTFTFIVNCTLCYSSHEFHSFQKSSKIENGISHLLKIFFQKYNQRFYVTLP